MRPPGPTADCVGSSGNRAISRRISENATGLPRGGFAPFTRISLGLSGLCENGAYVELGRNMRPPPDPWPAAYGLQESARFLGESQKPTHRPPAVGLRHVRGFLRIYRNSAKTGSTWCGGCNMRPPGSVVDCVGSSGNREISRRISETSTGPSRGSLAPFTRISLGLSEFGEYGPYVARVGEICGRLVRGRLRRIFRKSPATLRNFHMVHRGGFPPFTRISLDPSGLCENGA